MGAWGDGEGTSSGRAAAGGGRAGRVVRHTARFAALVAVIAAVVVVYQWLRPSAARPPTEFLPASARVAVGLNVRPDSPGMEKMRQAWESADIEHLGGRAADLAQEAVDWTGLQLDVRRDVSPWFGGELVAGWLADGKTVPFTPRSAVLVVRATSLGRARASLDRAVAPMARELEWRASSLRRAGARITVWRDRKEREQLAYALSEGCAVIGATAKTVEACLVAAESPARRLVSTPGFQRSADRLAVGGAVAWSYLDLDYAGRGLRIVGPVVRGGWLGLVRALREVWGADRAAAGGSAPDSDSALALALAPEEDGVRIRARYWRAGEEALSGSQPGLERLARFLPRETAAYIAAHGPRRWLSALGVLPSGKEGKAGGAGLPLGVGIALGALDRLPEEVLVAAVPREKGKPAFVMVAPAAGMEPGSRMTALLALSGAHSRTIGDFIVIASDEETLERCALAESSEEHRLGGRRGEGCSLEVWVKPAAFWDRMALFTELEVRVADSGEGGEAEAYLKVMPRHLLGD